MLSQRNTYACKNSLLTPPFYTGDGIYNNGSTHGHNTLSLAQFNANYDYSGVNANYSGVDNAGYAAVDAGYTGISSATYPGISMSNATYPGSSSAGYLGSNSAGYLGGNSTGYLGSNTSGYSGVNSNLTSLIAASNNNASTYSDNDLRSYNSSYQLPWQSQSQTKKSITQTRFPRKIKPPTKWVYCDVCKCSLNSPSQAQFHLKGQSHKKALAGQQEQGGKNDKTTSSAISISKSNISAATTTAPVKTIASLPKTVPSSQAIETKVSGVKNAITDPADIDFTEFSFQDITFKVVDSITGDEDETDNSSSVKPSSDQPQMKKKKDVPAIPCDICSLIFNSLAQAEAHFKGGKHNRKLNIMQKSLNDNSKYSMKSAAANRGLFNCSLCNVSLNSSVQYTQHCAGQSHKHRVQGSLAPGGEMKGSVGGWYFCNTCNISCQTASALHQHVMSEEHKSKIGTKSSSG